MNSEEEKNEQKYQQKYGSPVGLIGIIAIGFALYFLLQAVPTFAVLPSFEQLRAEINSPAGHFFWFLINFTEADFYAGAISSAFLLAGTALAWRLAVRKSKYAGFEICYGSAGMWPWIFASQILSLIFTEYVFGYFFLFDRGLTWIPTFIVLVGVPPSILYLYGPSIKNLITASVLGASICTPTAYWLSRVTATWDIPGAVNNVIAMAVTGIIAGCVCRVLPWMDRVELKPSAYPEPQQENYYSASWLMRRTVADLTEPLFYGNDVAAVFLLVGVCLEWILNPAQLTGGAMMLPAIILSQFISGGLGVFLYANKYKELGWYATYVPVVCTAPACILMFGATMPVILFSSVAGAVIGAPLAEFINDSKPDYIHGTVGNVTAMGLSTLLVAAALYCMPWIQF